MDFSSLGAGEVTSISSFLQQPADKYGNDERVELQWAMKAFQHAEVYFNLITAVDPKNLKLTNRDDEIYDKFKKDFPDVKFDIIDEDKMKSKEGKQEWREFCNSFENVVEDFNMATLLRLDCNGDVSENNTTIVPRIQFLAIEIARNREGYNSGLREKYGKKKSPAQDADVSESSESSKDTDKNHSEQS